MKITKEQFGWQLTLHADVSGEPDIPIKALQDYRRTGAVIVPASILASFYGVDREVRPGAIHVLGHNRLKSGELGAEARVEVWTYGNHLPAWLADVIRDLGVRAAVTIADRLH